MMKQEISGRNEDGTFKEGVSGNPKGRPVVSIVALLKEKLREKPGGEDTKTYLEQAVEVILEKAITNKEEKMIRDLIDRIDGKPKQAIDHTSDGEKIDGFVLEFVQPKNEAEDTDTR